MNAEPRTVGRRRLGIAGVAVAATLLTSACAAGQLAQTAKEHSSIDGTNETVGTIGLRGLALTAPATGNYYPAGSAIPVQVIFVNNGTQADTLTSITTSAAGGWGTYSSAAQAQLVQHAATAAPTPAATVVTSPAPSATAGSGTPTATLSATPSTSPATATKPSTTAPAPLPVGGHSVAIGAGSRASFGVPDGPDVLLLLKSKGRIYPGNTVPITFTFAKAGSITVAVPIQLTASAGTQVVTGDASGTS